jgi:hypothetical protein
MERLVRVIDERTIRKNTFLRREVRDRVMVLSENLVTL